MKTGSKYSIVLFLGLQMIAGMQCIAQKKDNGPVICDFTFADTVCKATPVTITNLSQ